jgi:hypothetical protein
VSDNKSTPSNVLGRGRHEPVGPSNVDPVIQFADPVLVIAHWHNAQIVDHGGPLTVEHVRQLKMNRAVMVTRHPKLITSISMVRPSVPMSSRAVHEELTKMLKQQQQSSVEMKGGTIVLEGRGVLGSAIRTVMRTVMMLTGNRQHQVVGSVEDAVPITLPFVRTSDDSTVTRAAFEHAIRKVRAAYDLQCSGGAATSDF